MKYDIIVIGAGLGGLTAGAKLARSGKKVLLLEQHDRPGGCATTFRRKDFTMEVGLHEMDGLHTADMKTRIFRDLGGMEKVEFLRVPEFYHFINGRRDFVVSHDPEEVEANLIKAFPGEEKGISAYFHRLMNIRKVLKEEAGKPEISVGEYMDSIIGNEDLKLILLGNLGYFDDDPYRLSLNYYCMAQSSYYQGGGNFIKGGSQVLSDYLAEAIRAEGGEVLLNTMADEIIVDGGKACGVSFTKTRSGEKQTAEADFLISNASIPQVADRLLPEAEGSRLRAQYKGLEPGASLLTVYFGFKKALKYIGYKYYSAFIYHPSVKSLKDIRINNHGDFSERSFTFVDYAQLDSGLAPEGKGVGAVCCIDYLEDWEGLSKSGYKEKKEEAALAFISRLEAIIPGFRDALEYYEVATAHSVQRFTLNPGGAVYGFAQTPERPGRKVEPPLENMAFASAWTKTGGGFSGAIFSGYLTAMEVIRKMR